MSSSDDQQLPAGPVETIEEPSGTVFTPHGEKSMVAIERSVSKQWSDKEVEDYLARVKEKAITMATQLLEEAKTEADTVLSTAQSKAEEARAQAHQEGFEKGYEEAYNKALADASEELEQFRSGMSESVAAVLSAIEGQCSTIFDKWRKDIVEVCRLSVEKMLASSLSEDRAEILANLLTEAIDLLESSREFVITVNPEDEPAISDIIETTKAKYPDVRTWKVRSDSKITPGGLIVENDSSLAEGLVESRKKAVEQVLAHLTLPNRP